jgi:tetratricopeptide repeat protein 21B
MILAKFIGKKLNEAKGYLKIHGKKDYDPQYGEELEKGWLLFADVLISVKKLPTAKALLNKCLKYNRSCGKAEEYLGLILEQEGQFDEAITHYKKAWKLSNFNVPSIGYRLSHCYFQNEDYINCVSVGSLILKKYPAEYAGIK